jgi:glucoamylase
MVGGAELLPAGERALLLAVADFWNTRLEDWCVARGTALGAAQGAAAHYVREAPPEILSWPAAMSRRLASKNRADDDPNLPASDQVGLEFLQLVRLGLRRADDPLIVDTLRLADTLLATDTPNGRVWHRYNGDGYGEHLDGSPFDGSGRGRGWPLLVGERGHYALAAGEDPLPYLQAMNAMAGAGGLIPEQVWDASPLPERGLTPGRPSGSAMPLAWAHAEFVKLAASRARGRVLDRTEAAWRRYGGTRPNPDTWVWTAGAPIAALAPGKALFILLPRPAVLRLGHDGWQGVEERPTREAGLGLHATRIPAGRLAGHTRLDFTWRWRDNDEWWGRDEQVRILPDN